MATVILTRKEIVARIVDIAVIGMNMLFCGGVWKLGQEMLYLKVGMLFYDSMEDKNVQSISDCCDS